MLSHIALIDNLASRRHELELALTAVGGFQVDSYISYTGWADACPTTPAQLLLVSTSVPLCGFSGTEIPLIRYSKSLLECALDPHTIHVNSQRIPAFAEQVRAMFTVMTRDN